MLKTRLSRSLLALLALALLAALGACSDDDLLGGVTVTGTGYSPHDGQTIYFALVDTGTGTPVATRSAVVYGGGFSVTFGTLAPLGLYTVDFYADGTPGGAGAGANGVCDFNAPDHVWQVAIDDANADGVNDVANQGTPSPVSPTRPSVTVNTVHNATFTNVCATF